MPKTSNFLKKKRFHIFSFSKMEKQSNSNSSISVDSLEVAKDQKILTKENQSSENVETILVPFYENDVLVKVPIDSKIKHNNYTKRSKSIDKAKKEVQADSYLVNKNKARRTTYLEMFRKQFSQGQVVPKTDEREIRSISPQFGDTERESIGEDANNPIEFYNTESYNEIYYERLLNQEMELLNNSFEEIVNLNVDSEKSPNASLNLRSVSEVSHHRRNLRRTTMPPVENINLGGLGPDMERIKPRLERARSLQRYSEKVRMDNKLRIYKKNVEAEMERQSARQTKSAKNSLDASYLVNKSNQDNKTATKKLYSAKLVASQKNQTKNVETEKKDSKNTAKSVKNYGKIKTSKNTTKIGLKDNLNYDVHGNSMEVTAKSSGRNRGINTENNNSQAVPPVHISFLVNVGKPSSMLKSLEEKHRMYQERIRAFTLDP